MFSFPYILRILFIIFLVNIGISHIYTQQLIDFENHIFIADTFINNSGESGGFINEQVFLPNDYNADWDAWSGWAISSVRDTIQPGFMNQYSAIPGGGNNGSTSFAVGFSSAGNQIKFTETIELEGLYVTNSTYAYYSVRDGDAFAKKFGGESGTDPDFLLLSIRKYHNGLLDDQTIEVYLADFRSNDPSEDFVLKTWKYVDLHELGLADSLEFNLTSTDNGPFGMNTPAYFCIDDLSYFRSTTAKKEQQSGIRIEAYPNPVHDVLTLNWIDNSWIQTLIYDIEGKVQDRWILQPGINTITINHLPEGIYFLNPILNGQRAPIKIMVH